MAKYLVSKVFITDPEHSVDGKKHKTTKYYSVMNVPGFGPMVAWVKKKDAMVFTSKREANKVAKQRDDLNIVEL